ncbi:unnamed protein product [Camellia sinensis]
MPNWELKKCCNHEQVVFLSTISICTVVILALWRTILLLPFKLVTVFLHEASHAIACKLTCGHVEAIQVNADEGGFTQTRGGVYWVILPAGYLGSAFWGMVLILASTNLLTARIAAGCFAFALLVVLFVAKNSFIILLGVIWVLQETTKIRILRYIILFIVYAHLQGTCANADIYDQLISRRDHSSDAEKFAEFCPCPCNGVGWGGIHIFFVSLWIHVPWPCDLVLSVKQSSINLKYSMDSKHDLVDDIMLKRVKESQANK